MPASPFPAAEKFLAQPTGREPLHSGRERRLAASHFRGTLPWKPSASGAVPVPTPAIPPWQARACRSLLPVAAPDHSIPSTTWLAWSFDLLPESI